MSRLVRTAAAGLFEWPGQDSNLRATDYESAALTTELPGLRRALAPAGATLAPRTFAVGSRSTMLVLGDQALGQTLALLATFLGIGILVNLLIFYIVAQVLAERKQNQETNRGTQ
jgi:hypothetical protein